MTGPDEAPLAILIATVGSWIGYQPLFRYPLRHDYENRESAEKVSRMNSSSDFNSAGPTLLKRTNSSSTNPSLGEMRQRSVDEQLSLLKGQPMSELMLYPICQAGGGEMRITAPSNIKVNGLRFVGWPMASPPATHGDDDDKHRGSDSIRAFNLVFVIRATCGQSVGRR